ncbi:hypothetical protein BaRGS_00015054 [Batillaria attramentaria]|uniref:Uncharacterized protein n=1 Tax=Batillaria attramentaria TaxID=370345 RepID=A0ABD0L314_9CAEN
MVVFIVKSCYHAYHNLGPPRVDDTDFDNATEHFVIKLKSSPSSHMTHVPFVANPPTDLVAQIFRATGTAHSNPSFHFPNHPLSSEICCEKFTVICSAYDHEQRFKAFCDVTISNVTSKDAGIYVMVVSNSAGSANVTIKLVGKLQISKDGDRKPTKDEGLWLMLGIILGTVSLVFLCAYCLFCIRRVYLSKKKKEDRTSLASSAST